MKIPIDLLLISSLLCTFLAAACASATESQRELPDFMSLWDYDHPEKTAAQFKVILPQARASDDRQYLAELLTQIARTHSLRGNFTAAHQLLDETEPLLSDDHPRPRLRYLLERGRTFNSAGKKDSAHTLFLEAWKLGKTSAEGGLAVDAAHMMAIVEPPEKQLDWNLKALQLAESSSSDEAKKWLGSLYNNIGWTYFGLEQHQKALDLFERRKGQKQVREIRIARWCIARTHRAMGDVEKALEIQEALHREIEASGAESDGYIFEELAECYLALERPEATRYFALAYEHLSKDQWLAKNEAKRLERLKDLGNQ